MTRVTSRSEPLLQSVRVWLRFASTHIIPFSSGSLFAILKNAVRVRLRFDKNSVKPVCKTPVRVRFDSLHSPSVKKNVMREYFRYITSTFSFRLHNSSPPHLSKAAQKLLIKHSFIKLNELITFVAYDFSKF